MAEQSLKDKTVKGTIWSGIDNVTHYGVSFIVSIILARLLSPDDYGLLGITAIFTAVCMTLINGGFSTALIRKKDASDEDYNTVFLTNLIASLVLYFVIYGCAPWIADYFNREELIGLVRVSSLGLIFGAFAMVQQTILTKRIDFKLQTKITVIASILSGIIGVSMALLNFGVWALVAQQLSTHVLRSILLWIFNKWRPRLSFSKKSFRELFGFGWKMMLSSLLDTIWKELYQVVVGKYYTPASLGQYTRANSFSQLFSTNLTSVIQRVTYPVLSNIQDQKERLVTAFRRIIKTTMFVSVVCMFSLGAVSEPLLYCLIGEKWLEAASYLPLICISGSLYPLHSINLNMLQVQGRGGLFLGIEIIKKIIGLLPFVVCVYFGILPMLYTNLLTSVLSYFLNSYYSGKRLGYSSWMQLKDIAPSYGLAMGIAVPVYLLKYLPLSYWVILPLQVMLGIAIFFFIVKISKMEEYEEVKGLLMPYISKNERFKK